MVDLERIATSMADMTDPVGQTRILLDKCCQIIGDVMLAEDSGLLQHGTHNKIVDEMNEVMLISNSHINGFLNSVLDMLASVN